MWLFLVIFLRSKPKLERFFVFSAQEEICVFKKEIKEMARKEKFTVHFNEIR